MEKEIEALKKRLNEITEKLQNDYWNIIGSEDIEKSAISEEGIFCLEGYYDYDPKESIINFLYRKLTDKEVDLLLSYFKLPLGYGEIETIKEFFIENVEVSKNCPEYDETLISKFEEELYQLTKRAINGWNEEQQEKDNYYDIPAISASQVKAFVKNPMDFWRTSVLNPNREKDLFAKNDPVIFGKLCHCKLFEPKTFKRDYKICDFGLSRTNKKFDIYCAENPNKIIVSQREIDHAERMKKALEKKKLSNDLLNGIQTEKPFFMTDEKSGLFLKGKVDAIKKLKTGEIIIIDYKTTNDVKKFYHNGHKDLHYLQVAMYEKLVRNRFNNEQVHFIFIVQNSKEGYEDEIGIFRYDYDSLCFARDELDNILERMSDYLSRFNAGDKTVWDLFPEEMEMQIPSYHMQQESLLHN